MPNSQSIDAVDAQILLVLDDEPNATILRVAHVLGISRNTVHARLQRIERAGLLRGFSQRVAPESLGYRLVAFLSLAVTQHQAAAATACLAAIPEVVEMHTTTGDADFLVKVVATDTADLYRITNAVLGIAGVMRSSTMVSLFQAMPNRTRALLEQLAGGAPKAPGA